MTTETPENETTVDSESKLARVALDLNQLPCTLNVPGFDEGYLTHQKEEKSKEVPSMIIMWLGISLTITGGLIILFGPKSLYISYSGPTLKEFFLLYPGPIASMGFLIAFLGGKIAPAIKSPLMWLDEHYHIDLQNHEESLDTVLFDYQGDDTFHVSMETLPKEEEDTSNPVN